MSAGLKETTEQLVKKKLEGKDKLTPWEEFMEKKKDRKKQKKSQRKQVSAATPTQRELQVYVRKCCVILASSQQAHGFLQLFSVLSFISFIFSQKEEELSEDELPPDVDLNDPFFAEELAATGNQYCKFISWSSEHILFLCLLHETHVVEQRTR